LRHGKLPVFEEMKKAPGNHSRGLKRISCSKCFF
jgi:hypothetical protein